MMDKSTIFSKTARGLMEIKNKASRLPKDPLRILSLVDGKAALRELVEKSRIAEVELTKALTLLSSAGFIKELISPAAGHGATSPADPTSSSAVDDLDFTQLPGPATSARPVVSQSSAVVQDSPRELERKASEAAAVIAQRDVARRSQYEAERVRIEADKRTKEDVESRAREKLNADEHAKEEIEQKAREASEREAKI